MINTYSDEELDKIQEIRKTLEGLCVRLAITNASDVINTQFMQGRMAACT